MSFMLSGGFNRFICSAIIVVSLCLSALPASAGEIYKWYDKQGRIHFSDTPLNEDTELIRETKDPEPVAKNPEENPTADSAQKESDKKSKEVKAKEEIKIPYVSKEGSASRVIVKVTFNNRVTAPMLVDTGAPGLIISADLADRLNLFDKNGSQLLVTISGIGGEEAATRTMINRISIGNITEESIPAHIVSDMSDSYDGLIGMDILSGYTLTIDPENEELIAREIPPSPDRPGGHSKAWWKGKFREFRSYKEYWDYHAMLVEKSGTAYARMPSQKRERYKKFILHQKNEADILYRKLTFKANGHLVPGYWRR